MIDDSIKWPGARARRPEPDTPGQLEPDQTRSRSRSWATFCSGQPIELLLWCHTTEAKTGGDKVMNDARLNGHFGGEK